MSNTSIICSITTYSNQYNIEPNFVKELYDRGLILLERQQDEYYILEDQLSQLEHFTRLHCDLDINAAGIEIVEDLLLKIQDLKEKMRILESKISLIKDID